jgi:hypothetical protein
MPAAGVTTTLSFAARATPAATPSIVTSETVYARRSSVNSDRACVAFIVISVCEPGSIVFAAGSYLNVFV